MFKAIKMTFRTFLFFFVCLLGFKITTSTIVPDDHDKVLIRNFYKSSEGQLFSKHGSLLLIQTTKSPTECCLKCIQNKECLSVNIVTEEPRRLRCELLKWTGKGFEKYLKSKINSKFMQIKNPCEENPCSNGGQCIFDNDEQDYRCMCKMGFAGRQCQFSTDENVDKSMSNFLENSTILSKYGNQSYVKALTGFMATTFNKTSPGDWVRCWHASQDGWDTRLSFHPQCDGKKATVTIVRVGQYVFGGFTDKSWHSAVLYTKSSRSFLFSLYNINGFQPIQLNLTKLNHEMYAIYGNKAYGPAFGWSSQDLRIVNLAINYVTSLTIVRSYDPPPGCSIGSSCSYFAGRSRFTPNDVEVFYYTGQITKGLQNSTILTDYGNDSYVKTLDRFVNTALQQSNPSKWVRCWHAAEDGWDTRLTFHPQCDGKKATVTIVRVGQYVFGGFTDKSWFSGVAKYTESSKSFLFSLYNTKGYQPIQLNLTTLNHQKYAIYGNKAYGPAFGWSYQDLRITNLAINNANSLTIARSYEPPPGCNIGYSCSYFAGQSRFTPDDVEVFYYNNETRGLENSAILVNHGNDSYIKTLIGFLDKTLQLSSGWVRCWHAAQDGWDTRITFHPQCDGKKASVTIVRVGQYLFGGFTDKSWHSAAAYTKSSRSFLFSLYNINGYQPIRMNLTRANHENYATYGNAAYGPTFGYNLYDLYIANLAKDNSNSRTVVNSYQPPPGCRIGSYCSYFAGQIKFTPSDIEVFYYDENDTN